MNFFSKLCNLRFRNKAYKFTTAVFRFVKNAALKTRICAWNVPTGIERDLLTEPPGRIERFQSHIFQAK